MAGELLDRGTTGAEAGRPEHAPAAHAGTHGAMA
jgi:hypothetical protein